MKYLSAKQLNITPAERTALLKVKRFLARVPMPKECMSRINHDKTECTSPAPALFNMNRSVAKYDCGTGFCIGGWMVLAMKEKKLKKVVKLSPALISKIDAYVQNSEVLGRLFFPHQILNYDSITPQDAQQEIVTFLRTGKATW